MAIFVSTSDALKKLYRIIMTVAVLVALFFTIRTAVRVVWIASFHIPSDSMEPALFAGDYVLAQRLRENTAIRHNDVLFFRFPYAVGSDSVGNPHDGSFYVKRCIALPGDTVEIRNGMFRVSGFDGVPGNPQGQERLVGMLGGIMDERHAPARSICLEAWPWDDSLGWTVLEFGPLFVPSAGSEVKMNAEMCLLYRQYIEWEQHAPLSSDESGNVYLGDSMIDSYTFEKDYYFVAGDKSENSRDSRYWGLLPRDFIRARAWRIKYSEDPAGGKPRFGRIGRRII